MSFFFSHHKCSWKSLSKQDSTS